LAAAGAIAGAEASRAEQAPMTFRAVSLGAPNCGAKCPEVVVADGVIEENTPQAFIDFAKGASLSQRLRSVVFLNSPGGNVVASMELGTAFRRLRSAAIVAGFASQGEHSGPVAGQCLSACVYALMGAFRRVVPNESRVGLHRMAVPQPEARARGVASGSGGLADQIRGAVGRRPGPGVERRIAFARRAPYPQRAGDRALASGRGEIVRVRRGRPSRLATLARVLALDLLGAVSYRLDAREKGE
jgi:hypothetical protein